jgi:hypothetical protein
MLDVSATSYGSAGVAVDTATKRILVGYVLALPLARR